MNAINYVKIARVDHWFKNIFMVPGLIVALLYVDFDINIVLALKVVVAFFGVSLVCSANYVINEWLDAEFDKFHPKKKNRPSVAANLNPKIVYAEYFLLALAGLALSLYISMPFFICAFVLLLMGFLYNVNPFRTKDKFLLDVLSESINNPLRLLLGWYIIVGSALPPSSLLISYWMGGAFLMGTKRFAEYRFINNPETASLYRKSFRNYTEKSLLISTFFYALLSSFFLAIFLFKHRLELIISFPFFSLLFAWYLNIGFKENSPVQNPEKLYREVGFSGYFIFLFVLCITLLFVDIPFLNFLLN